MDTQRSGGGGWALAAGLAAAVVGWIVAWRCGFTKPACWTTATTVLCAVWWVSEAIPIAATALVPFVAFPLTGVLTHQQVAGAYGHSLILMFLGGFILSAAMERSGTHRRLAIGLLKCVGTTSQRRLVLGFMLASAGLSMWISNTATVLMLLPIAAAVLEKVDDDALAIALVLGVAYAGSIGGLGTPIGSPPNLIFIGIYQEVTGVDLSFLAWMKIGLPVVIVMLPIAWLLLTRHLHAPGRFTLPPMGPWQPAEVRMVTVFILTALAWMTRSAPYGGWSTWLGVPGVGDSTVALLAAVALFIVPDGRGQRLMDWEATRGVPWGILILFGGGLAIARAFDESGLDQVLGQALTGITAWPVVVMVFAICLSVSFLTEVTSNTATATLLMPILAAAAAAAHLEPAVLMMPAAISASCAFMLPVATPPNAIVFATGRLTIKQMMREGFLLNLIGAAVVTAVSVALVGSYGGAGR